MTSVNVETVGDGNVDAPFGVGYGWRSTVSRPDNAARHEREDGDIVGAPIARGGVGNPRPSRWRRRCSRSRRRRCPAPAAVAAAPERQLGVRVSSVRLIDQVDAARERRDGEGLASRVGPDILAEIELTAAAVLDRQGLRGEEAFTATKRGRGAGHHLLFRRLLRAPERDGNKQIAHDVLITNLRLGRAESIVDGRRFAAGNGWRFAPGDAACFARGSGCSFAAGGSIFLRRACFSR